MIAKNSNDEIVSILDVSVRTGALFLQIDTISVSRPDAGFSSVTLFLKINAAFVSRRNTSVF